MIEPHHPVPYTEAQLYAVRALFDGKASEGQQTLALEWILWSVCGLNRSSYRPGQPDATVFAEGRRAVGLDIAYMRKPEALAAIKAKPGRKPKQTEAENGS